MALYLIKSFGKECSKNNFKKIFNLGSANTRVTYSPYFFLFRGLVAVFDIKSDKIKMFKPDLSLGIFF